MNESHELQINYDYTVLNEIMQSTSIDPLKNTMPIKQKMIEPTEKFFQSLTGKFNNHYKQILPEGCKFLYPLNPKRNLLLIESPPVLRTIAVKPGIVRIREKLQKEKKIEKYGLEFLKKLDEESTVRVRLSFPYIVFIMTVSESRPGSYYFNDAKVFYRLAPVRDFSDYLLRCNLYNVNNDRICMGNIKSEEEEKRISLSSYIDNVMEAFWINVFNRDYTYHISLYEDVPEISNIFEWQYHSLEDPMFIFRIPWIEHEKTVGQELTCYIKRHSENGGAISFPYLLDHCLNKIENEPSYNYTLESFGIEQWYQNGVVISIGDELKIGDKLYYVQSFDENPNVKFEPENVILESDESTVKLPIDEAISILSRQIYGAKEIDEIRVDGKRIKVGDEIIIKMVNRYEKRTISSIFQDYNRKVLISTKEDNFNKYFIENLPFNLFKSNEFVDAAGETVKSGDKCRVRKSSLTRVDQGIAQELNIFSFKKLVTNENSLEVYAECETPSGVKSFRLSQVLKDNIEENLTFVNVARVGNLLLNSSLTHKLYIKKGEGFYFDVHPDFEYSQRSFPEGFFDPTFQEEFIKLTLEETDCLKIPSFDSDICFTKGDNVIIADWEDPKEMLKIRKIFDFRFLDNILYICTETTDTKERRDEPFISFKDHVILAGHIRRVEMEHKLGNLVYTSGMKIQALNAGIPNFPKKDVNEIIAFTTDGMNNNELVLCSNYCTFPIRTLPCDFKLVNPNVQNSVVDPDTIKYQFGDLYISNYFGEFKGYQDPNIFKTIYSFLIVVGKNRNLVDPKACIDYVVTALCMNRLDYHRIYGFNPRARLDLRYGLLSPRRNLSYYRNNPTIVNSFPDFHGGFTTFWGVPTIL